MNFENTTRQLNAKDGEATFDNNPEKANHLSGKKDDSVNAREEAMGDIEEMLT